LSVSKLLPRLVAFAIESSSVMSTSVLLLFIFVCALRCAI
jgi:hypothetical protein